jgi:nitrate reductase gamma subunit
MFQSGLKRPALIFCVGVLLSLIAHFVLQITSEAFVSQLLVSAAAKRVQGVYLGAA